jgi:hypothetical protein
MTAQNFAAKSEAQGAKFRTPGAATVRTVFAMVVANAATQFAIQAWMSYRFAKDVWSIPRPLCLAIIVALDLFAVTFMIFTYLLRTASALSRLYVWAIFALGVGAQLFAAELYGSHEHWDLPVRMFAGLPALFLAASLHGLIIWRNHANPPVREPRPVRVPTSTVPRSAIENWGKAPKTERPPRPTVAPATPPVSSGAGAPHRTRRGAQATGRTEQREAAAKRVVDGEAAKDVAAELRVSRRSVELWVKAYREQLPSSPSLNGVRKAAGMPELDPGVFTQSDLDSINSYGFEQHTDGPAEVVAR